MAPQMLLLLYHYNSIRNTYSIQNPAGLPISLDSPLAQPQGKEARISTEGEFLETITSDIDKYECPRGYVVFRYWRDANKIYKYFVILQEVDSGDVKEERGEDDDSSDDDDDI